MIAPLDETCEPNPVLDENSPSPMTVVPDPQGQLFITAEGIVLGTIVTSDLRDEDCPGSRTGDGCE